MVIFTGIHLKNIAKLGIRRIFLIMVKKIPLLTQGYSIIL